MAYQDEVILTDWHHVGVYVHDARGLISALTDHFSSWASGTEPGAWHYQWRPPTVSQFSGAASYQYPIPVPPGRAGLTPNLDATYSSRGVDMAIGSGQDQGALGMGWNIGSFEVTRDDLYTFQAYTNTWYVYPDKFSLALNGGSHHLIPGGNYFMRQTGDGVDYNAAFYRSRYNTGNNMDLAVWFRVDNAATANTRVYIENMTNPNTSGYVRQGFAIFNGNLVHHRAWNEGGTWKESNDYSPISVTANTWYHAAFHTDGQQIQSWHSEGAVYSNTYLSGDTGWRLRATTKTGNTDLNHYREITNTVNYYVEPFSAINQTDWTYNSTLSHTATFETNSPFSDDWVQRYYAEDGPGLYVERRYEPTNPNTNFNVDKFYWVARTGNGTTYRLGYTPDAESGQTRHMYTPWLEGSTGHPGADQSNYVGTRWRVDTVTDRWGNQIQYRYDTWLDTSGGTDAGMRRLSELRYNFSVTATNHLTRVVSTTAASLVKLVDLTPGDSLSTTDKIDLYHTDLTTPYRSISFGVHRLTHTQAGCEATTQRVLTITEHISGGASLPPTTFGYQALPHWDDNCYYFQHLAQVNNGYGARMDFLYQSDGRQDTKERVVTGTKILGHSYLVTQTKTWDGVNAQPAVVSYTYAIPCYDDPNTSPYDLGDLPGAWACPAGLARPGMGDWMPYVGPLVGFKVVTMTALAFDGVPAATSATWFHQDQARSGKPYLAQTLDPVTQAVLQQSDSVYLTTTITNTTFSYLGVVTSTAFYSGGHSLSRRTEYDYATGLQGGVQYGNQTHVREYDTTGALFRQTATQYFPNPVTSTWLVAQPAVITITDGSGAVLKLVHNHYDGSSASNYLQAPQTYGALTAARNWTASNQWQDSVVTYDAWGLPSVARTYNAYGTDSAFASGDPRAITNTYDSTYHLYLTNQENPLGQRVTTTYSLTLGLPLTVTDENNQHTLFQYDVFGRLTAVIRPGDSATYPTVKYAYGTSTAPWTITTTLRTQSGCGSSSCEQVSLAVYDGFGRGIQSRAETQDNAQQSVSTQGYDALGRVITSYVPGFETWSTSYTTPGAGLAKSTTRYDPLGQAVLATAPDGTQTASVSGYKTQITQDANQNLKITFTDDFGRVNGVDEVMATWRDDFSGGGLSEWTNSGGVVESGGQAIINGSAYITRPIGGDKTGLSVSFNYNGHSATTAVIGLRAGISGTDSYRRWALTISNGVLYRHIYSGTVTETVPLLTLKADTWYRAVLKAGTANSQAFIAAAWERDNPGVAAIRRDVQDAQWGGQSWNSVLQVTSVGEAMAVDDYAEVAYYPTRYTYNVRDQLIQVKDALSNTTIITYDGIGQKVGMLDPDMGNWVYSYTALGALQTQVDARGCKVNFTYDVLGRLTDKFYTTTTCSGVATTGAVHYSYDGSTVSNGKGRRTQMFDALGWSAWAYDARGQVISTTQYITGVGTYYTTYGYDSAGRVVSMTYPNGSNSLGETVYYTYNTAGAVVSATGLTTYLKNAGYDAVGRPLTLTVNNGFETTYAYYNWTQQGGRLQSLQTIGKLGANLLNLSYAYDAVGNVQTITTTNSPTETRQFGYDALDRLTWAKLITASTTTTESYAYDAIGNILFVTNTGTLTYTYGDAAHKHAVTSITGGPTYAYDANGNATNRNDYVLGYDAEGRLVTVNRYVVDEGDEGYWQILARFSYNGDGQRVKTILGFSDTTIHIGNYYEFKTNNTLSRTYYYAGAQRLAVRERTAGGNGTLYLLAGDHLGSTSIVASSSGTLHSELRYDAWGETRYSNGVTPTDFRYTGQKQTTSGGSLDWLYYYNARWYDPYLNRWLQPDSIVPDPANPQDLNRYSYVRNNPIKHTDPSGHRVAEEDENPQPRRPPLYGVVIILACGYGTTTACASDDPSKLSPDYSSIVSQGLPMQGLADAFEARGATVIYMDHDSNGTKIDYRDAILREMATHKSAKQIFLAGHSSGADAVMLAAIANPNKVNGIAVFDSYLSYGIGPAPLNRILSDSFEEEADAVAKHLGDNLYAARSDSKDKSINLPGNQYTRFRPDDHIQLAGNPDAMDQAFLALIGPRK